MRLNRGINFINVRKTHGPIGYFERIREQNRPMDTNLRKEAHSLAF